MTPSKAAMAAAGKLWDYCGYAWPEANREGFIDKAAIIIDQTMAEYCRYCGEHDPDHRCQCENDE